MRIVTLLIGLILLAAGGVWFFTSLIDAPVMTVAGGLAKPGAAKLALDNTLSLIVAGIAVVGLILLVWGATMGGGRGTDEPAAG